jgi:LysM repeat protein
MPASVYRRRRLAVLGVAVLCVFTIWVLAQTVVNAVSSRQATTESMQTISAVQPTADADSAYWTVRPGDTLWSIAQAVTPRGDIRPVLKRLDDRYGSSTLVAGQHILVS